MLSVNSLYKTFNNNLVLNDVSLDVEGGSVLLLSGMNGSGKTTLLKVLCGISSFNSGNISFNNIDLNDDNYNQNVNFLCDKECLYSHLTVIKNLLLILSMQCVKYDQEDIKRTLKSLNILGKKDIIIDRLSTGQIQKVKIARMMLNSNCNLCLLDEPESNLDIDGLKVLIQCLRKWKEKNKVIVLATHNIDLYKELNPTIYKLD